MALVASGQLPLPRLRGRRNQGEASGHRQPSGSEHASLGGLCSRRVIMQERLIRRARVWDIHLGRWLCVQPLQEWAAGEVSHPAFLCPRASPASQLSNLQDLCAVHQSTCNTHNSMK